MVPMERPTTADPLLILAMDQRDSFAKLFGTEEDEATPEQVEQMRAAKTLIYRGVAAVAGQVQGAQIGVLTDEEYGPAVLAAGARRRSGAGVPRREERSDAVRPRVRRRDAASTSSAGSPTTSRCSSG